MTNAGEVVFSKANYGSMKRAFVILEKDGVLSRQIQEWMIENNPPNWIELIGGSNHMVMTSQPTKLVASLLGIAQDLS